jgi:hypothetical protein
LLEQLAPPVRPGDPSLVHLACVDDDAQGQTLEVLWEKELAHALPIGWYLAPAAFHAVDAIAVAVLSSVRVTVNVTVSVIPCSGDEVEFPFRISCGGEPWSIVPVTTVITPCGFIPWKVTVDPLLEPVMDAEVGPVVPPPEPATKEPVTLPFWS